MFCVLGKWASSAVTLNLGFTSKSPEELLNSLMARPHLPLITWEFLEVKPRNNYFLSSPRDSNLKPSLRDTTADSGMLGIQER